MSIQRPDYVGDVRKRLQHGELPPALTRAATAAQVQQFQVLQRRALEAHAGGPGLTVEEAQGLEEVAEAWAEAATGHPAALCYRYPRIAAALLRGDVPKPRDVWGPLGPLLVEVA